MSILSSFTYYFFHAIWHVRAVILALIALVVAGAAAVTLVEKMPFTDTLYFAFVTGLTLGYGDIEAVGMLRHLTGIEALTGLVLITWSASFLFLEMQRYWPTR